MGLRKTMAMAGVAVFAGLVSPMALHGLERLTLRNGSTYDGVRHESVDDSVRFYIDGESSIDFKAAQILSIDVLPDPAPVAVVPAAPAKLTKADLGEMLASAGKQHNIDADLLASIVKAESNGQTRAVSRAGAQGLMQLMPGTARELGVADSFEPEQNINGGTQYLDALLTRYNDNIALAVAAYNAGPAAVDRYHGVPPYRETRVYVARVVNEFNRRINLRKKAQATASKSLEIAAK